MGSDDPNIAMFRQVKVQRPADLIIGQIRELIRTGKLRPGDRLPSERVLADRLHVGRFQVREAIKKLEFYGILETRPNRGTIVASLGVKALEGLIATILKVDQDDFQALFDTREMLEVFSAETAARKATNQDIEELRALHKEFARQVGMRQQAVEEDHLFHLRIAECSKNSILCSLIGLITPDIIAMAHSAVTPGVPSRDATIEEHSRILDAIADRDSRAAYSAMKNHMEMSRTRRFGGADKSGRQLLASLHVHA